MANNRTILVNQLTSLAGSEKAYAANTGNGATANNAAAVEAQLAVGTRSVHYLITNCNAAANVLIGGVSAAEHTGNSVIANVAWAVNSANATANTTDYASLVVFKCDSTGTRVNVAEVNIGNTTTVKNVFSYATSINTANAEVGQNCTIGVQVVKVLNGSFANGAEGLVTITLRPK